MARGRSTSSIRTSAKGAASAAATLYSAAYYAGFVEARKGAPTEVVMVSATSRTSGRTGDPVASR